MGDNYLFYSTLFGEKFQNVKTTNYIIENQIANEPEQNSRKPLDKSGGIHAQNSSGKRTEFNRTFPKRITISTEGSPKVPKQITYILLPYISHKLQKHRHSICFSFVPNQTN